MCKKQSPNPYQSSKLHPEYFSFKSNLNVKLMKCFHPIQLINHFHPTLLNLYHSPSNTMAWIVVLRLFKGTLTSTIAFDNTKGPFPHFLLMWALIEAMENHLIHTHTTPLTHFGHVCVGECSPIINCHYFMPCCLNESRFFFWLLLVPYLHPPQLLFVGGTIFPFFLHIFF